MGTGLSNDPWCAGLLELVEETENADYRFAIDQRSRAMYSNLVPVFAPLEDRSSRALTVIDGLKNGL